MGSQEVAQLVECLSSEPRGFLNAFVCLVVLSLGIASGPRHNPGNYGIKTFAALKGFGQVL